MVFFVFVFVGSLLALGIGFVRQNSCFGATLNSSQTDFMIFIVVVVVVLAVFLLISDMILLVSNLLFCPLVLIICWALLYFVCSDLFLLVFLFLLFVAFPLLNARVSLQFCISMSRLEIARNSHAIRT